MAGVMDQKLAHDFLLHERYRIEKALAFSADHGVYQAHDMKEDSKSWIVKEYIPPAPGKLSEEELKIRGAHLQETFETISQFDHPNLPKIPDFFEENGRHYLIMEPVDGLTLKAISDMSVDRVEETQILEWAHQISEALDYLHSRPKPLVHSLLDPEHIMVDSENRVKLVNLGLDGFFNPDKKADAFSTNIFDLVDDFYEMGKTFYFLYTRHEFNPQEIEINIPAASEKASKVVQRLLSDDPQRNYREAQELSRDLRNILKPPSAEPSSEVKKKFDFEEPFYFRFLPTKKNIDRAVNAILSQKIIYFVMEIVGIIAIITLLWMSRHPGWNYTKNSSIVICSCQNELWTINSEDRRLLERKKIDGLIKGIASSSDGSTVYLANFTMSEIMKMSTLHNEIGKGITADRNPSRIYVRGPYLFSVNEMTNNVAMISLLAKESITIIPTGLRPVDLAYSPGNGLLFISNSTGESVHIINPVTNVTKSVLTMEAGAGPLALTPDEKLVYIANTKYGALTVLDTKKLEVANEIQLPALKKASALRFSADGEKLFILDSESASLMILSIADDKVDSTIAVGKNPIDMTLDNKGKIWIANNGSHTISIVNPELRYLENTIAAGRKPEAIHFVP